MSVLKQSVHRANLARSGFDVGQEFAFTSSTGMILPVYKDYLNAGESVYYSGELLMRTQPLVTAAMCDVDIYLDWFFVPCSMLYTLFPSMRWMTNDIISSFYDSFTNNPNMDFPLMDIDGVLRVAEADRNKAVNTIDSTLGYGNTFDYWVKSHFRMLDALGFNPLTVLYPSNGISGGTPDSTHINPNVFPLYALAYQAIYMDYYRLPFENFETRDIQRFNWDAKYNWGQLVQDAAFNPFVLRYRMRHKDYFNEVLPSAVVNVKNVLGATGTTSLPNNALDALMKIDSYLTLSSYDYITNTGASYSTTQNGAKSLALKYRAGTSNPSATTMLSVANIRSLFALDKLLRITNGAKKDYDSQVLAHFGFEVPHDVKHELTHLKTQHTLLHIGEVLSTADTFNSSSGSGSALGSIGGRGIASIQRPKKDYKFTAPCDGVIMCCQSAVPRSRYYDAFDKLNAVVNRLSFYQPEFDKLGRQPIFAYEAYGYNTNNEQPDTVFGWQNRYSQFKIKYDRVSWAFRPAPKSGTVNTLAPWVVSQAPFGARSVASSSQPGDTYAASPVSYPFATLLCTPHDLDGIMQVPYIGSLPLNTQDLIANPSALFYTDPFINAFRANVKKVSVMSITGEPDLD